MNDSLPPPIPKPSESHYWIRGEDRDEYGPVTLKELKDWVAEDRAGNGTWVRKEVGDWSIWESYPELLELSSTEEFLQATFISRFIAFFIDYLLLTLAVSIAMIVVWGDFDIFQQPVTSFDEMLQRFQSPVYAELSIYMKLIMEGAHILYFGWFLGRPLQTLGKKIMGIRVVDAEGRALTRRRGWMRAVASVISLQFFWVGYWIAIFNPGLRSLHDWLVQTRVVKGLPPKEKEENETD